MPQHLTLGDLVEQLSEILDDLGPDTKVRIGIQPSYPLREAPVQVATTLQLLEQQAEAETEAPDEDGIAAELDAVGGNTVWIASAAPPYDENPYEVPQDLWGASGW